MTTGDKKLTEQIAQKLHEVDPISGHDPRWDRLLKMDREWYRIKATAVLPILRLAQAEAVDGFRAGLADHLDLGTPRAWGFRHPCDPPGVRWEPTERDRALMDVADLVRNDTLNPYRETGDSDERR